MRLIDADALKVDWYDDYEMDDGDEYSYPYVSQYQIDKAPTIDAEPVRHGHWIKEEYWSEGVGMGEVYGYYYRCSNCSDSVQGGYRKCDDKYCRNCGARMDEENKDAE